MRSGRCRWATGLCYEGMHSAAVMNKTRAIGWLLDGVWLVALALYVLSGYKDVPFHGDESTLIDMSRDYHLLVQQHDFSAVFYRDSPDDPAAQEHRILNGTVGKMAMGLAWDLDGLTEADLNWGWDWGADWEWNLAARHLPSERLLNAARLSSVLFTILGVWCVFGIAWLAGGGRVAAWAASLIFATTPAVLLNGRRAMMEGSHLGFTALAVLAALVIVRMQARPAQQRRTLWGVWIAFGAAAGLALASKHTAALAIGLTGSVAALQPIGRGLWRAGLAWRQLLVWEHWGRVVSGGAVAAIVFLALNPAWWTDPIGMPGRVGELRSNLLEGQADTYGRFSDLGAQAKALAQESFVGKPQWYEDPAWGTYPVITHEIEIYENRWYAGRPTGPLMAALLALACGVGSVALVRRWRDGIAWLVLVWAYGTAAMLLLTIPMHWQRYYLPLQIPLAVVAGMGVWQTGIWLRRAVARTGGEGA